MNTPTKRLPLASPAAFGAVLLLLSLGLARSAAAVCDQTGASEEDLAVQALLVEPCPDDYFKWHAKAYRARGEAWAGRGYDQACNVNLEYMKHWLATALIRQGIDFATVGTDGDVTFIVDRAFHSGIEDYGPLTEGQVHRECTMTEETRFRPRGQLCQPRWHDEYFNVPIDTLGNGIVAGFASGVVEHDVSSTILFVGLWREIFERNDIVFTTCEIYNPAPSGVTEVELENPGELTTRAGVLVHEAWHGRLKGSNSVNDLHQAIGCQQPDEPVPPAEDRNCDRLIPRDKVDAEGQLWMEEAKGPFQVEREFYCDLADRPSAWLPISVQQEAAFEAARIADENLAPIPPEDCGLPVPLYEEIALGARCLSGALRCGAGQFTCAQGEICDTDGCCVDDPFNDVE